MRYDKTIYFRTVSRTYDSTTGDYSDEVPTDVSRKASVMDTKTALMQMVYGGVRQGSLTIHIQSHYTDPFQWIVYGGKRYRVDYQRKLRTKHTFIVSEVDKT